MTVLLAIAGATGRTGSELLAACRTAEDLRCTGALVSKGSAALGYDIGDVNSGYAMDVCAVAAPSELAEFDVLIDFSTPQLLDHLIDLCITRKRALLVGTTGHSEQVIERLVRAAAQIPIVRSANMSIGVNVLLHLVADVARALPNDFEVELIDVHHRFKGDAPSGTALALAETIHNARPDADAPSINSLRMGGRTGDHSVLFGSLDETVTISHTAHNRALFAAGALRAARWLVDREPGYYTMQDVLFGTPTG